MALDSIGQPQRSREVRQAYHMPSLKNEDMTKMAQLSQSPSDRSLMPLVDGIGSAGGANGQRDQTKSMNPGGLNKNSSSLIKIQKQPNHQSPSFKRIVNIYSVNNYKKKKYILSGGSVSNQASNYYNVLPTTTSNSSIQAVNS